MDGEEEAREYADDSAQTSTRPRLWLPTLLCSLLLAVELYVLLYDIDTSPQLTSARPVIAMYVSGVNDVLGKQAGTITWRSPTPGADLRREDTILTMANSNALVRFTDGTEMGIEPDSLVLLEKTPPEDANQKIVVKLMQGSLAKTAAGTLPLAVDVDVKGSVTKTRIEDATGSATFRLSATTDGVAVQVDSGNVKLGEGVNAKVVTESQQAVVRGDKIEVHEVPLRFSGLEPTLGKKLARDDDDQPVVFSWRQVAPPGKNSDVDPRVLLGRRADMQGANEINVDRVKDGRGRAEFKPKADGTYYWRLDSEDRSAHSAVASFSVVTRMAPKTEGAPNYYETFVGKPLTVRWRELPSTATVFVEVSEDDEFTSVERIDPPKDAREVELKFSEAKTVYWRLRADYGPPFGVSPPTRSRELVVKPKSLLKPPKLRKPKLRVSGIDLDREPNAMFLSAIRKSRTLSVDLEWAPVEGASEYHLQIAEDRKFKKLVVDKRLKRTRYVHKLEQIEQDQVFYYRIASVDEERDEGPFSSPETIEVPPLPKEHIAQPGEEEEPPRRQRFRLDLALGAAFHSRDFKSSDTKPYSASGKGFIPMHGSTEWRYMWDGDDEVGIVPTTVVDIGASVIGEKAEPETKNVKLEEYPLSLARFWAMLEKPNWALLGAGAGSLGLYASTSQKFTWSGRKAQNDRIMLIGLSAALSNSSLGDPTHLHWRVQLAPTFAGGIGADLAANGRYMFSTRRAVRALDQIGFFVDGELFVRFMTVEQAFGGAFKLGYSF